MSKLPRLLTSALSLIAVLMLVSSSLLLGAGQALATSTTIPLEGIAWNHTSITYSISASKPVSPTAVAAIKQGLANWNTAISGSSVQKLRDFQFVPAARGQKADVQIKIKAGTGVVLGSTHLFPNSDGSINHTVTEFSGKAFGSALSTDDLTTISVHELGHSLGLGHADNPSDPMYAYMNGVKLYPSSCDLTGFAAVEDWYVSSSATFYAPTVSSVTC